MSIKYRSEIDGLRAIAVLSVVFFHAGFSFMHRGFLGVDIFFVISGYLITSVILKDLYANRFSFSNFYNRRVRRILPALFLVIVVSTPFALFLCDSVQLDSYKDSVFATFLFISNFFFAQIQSDYWAAGTELSPMLHTWSLAVEEQFYIVFPFLLIFLVRFKSIVISSVLGLVILSSLLFSIFVGPMHEVNNFYMLTSRFWELGAGALIATAQLDKKEFNDKILNVLSFIGFILVVYALVAIPLKNTFPGFATIPVILGTAMILAFARRGTTVAAILSWKPFVFVGLLSYSFYLWHQPVFVFIRIFTIWFRQFAFLDTKLFFSVAIIFCLGLSWLSWKYVEKPFRHIKVRKNIIVFAMSFCVALFIGACLQMIVLFSFNTETVKQLIAKYPNSISLAGCTDEFQPDCATSDKPEMLVWGDSYAGSESGMITASSTKPNFALMTKSACLPFLPIDEKISASGGFKKYVQGCVEFKKKVEPYIESHKSLKYVALISLLESPDLDDFAKKKKNNDPALYQTDLYIVAHGTLKWIKDHGMVPILVRPAARRIPDVGRVADTNFYEICAMDAMSKNLSADHCRISRQDADEAFHSADVFIDTFKDEAAILDLRNILCDDKWCDAVMNGAPIYYDIGGHMTKSGAEEIGKKFNIYQKLIDVAEAFKKEHMNTH